MKKDFLTFADVKKEEITKLIARALFFKKNKKKTFSKLKGQVLALIFEKESTRTRLSFEVAMMKLGGQVIYLGAQNSQLSRGETYADTARVMSRYVNGMMLRTFSHSSIEELAKNATVPVVNGLTDLHHPCQVLADYMTLIENKKDPKKLFVSYVGDGNNMTHSWIELADKMGLKLNIACPRGFAPDAGIVSQIKNKNNIRFFETASEAVKDCDVINTDTWFSMGQVVSDEKREAFSGFQVNKKLLELAKPKAIVLHCLPAHRGEEITDEILDGPQSRVFDQAENRLYVQMALLERLMG